ncbi:hypothetical protein [Acidovorax sp. CCYZU-2555]|uniref:hypothetical protein n=1 Tax=Acidovorax sp. CCYZU-2555 TaxID=2835042 RepID=UPI001BCE8F4A|nr:hypothetical protein [Acidovorax sp. CCYZU-2555]MBS7776717.1 hypothetical protein [Acidovorax sp. CCYZU-2555]
MARRQIDLFIEQFEIAVGEQQADADVGVTGLETAPFIFRDCRKVIFILSGLSIADK